VEKTSEEKVREENKRKQVREGKRGERRKSWSD